MSDANVQPWGRDLAQVLGGSLHQEMSCLVGEVGMETLIDVGVFPSRENECSGNTQGCGAKWRGRFGLGRGINAGCCQHLCIASTKKQFNWLPEGCPQFTLKLFGNGLHSLGENVGGWILLEGADFLKAPIAKRTMKDHVSDLDMTEANTRIAAHFPVFLTPGPSLLS